MRIVKNHSLDFMADLLGMGELSLKGTLETWITNNDCLEHDDDSGIVCDIVGYDKLSELATYLIELNGINAALEVVIDKLGDIEIA